MTTIRRVVTGHNSDGKSVVSSDEQITGVEIPGLSGFEILNIWGSDKTHSYPDDGTKPKYEEFFAPVGGYRFLIFTVPPDSAAADQASKSDAVANSGATAPAFPGLPGLLETFDPKVPGMHRSATVDLLYVMEGRCELELDDGVQVSLAAGDTFVQSGTMHAWRNPHNVQCKIIAAIVGASPAGIS